MIAFDSLSLPVWCIDERAAMVVYANACARDWCGWPIDGGPVALAALAGLLSIEAGGRRRPLTIADLRRVDPGGTCDAVLAAPRRRPRSLLLSSASMLDSDGDLRVLIAVAERSGVGSQARQVDGVFLAQSVAHELNNIVASLHGFVELAAERAAAGSPLDGYLGEIRTGVSRITDLATILENLAEAGGKPIATRVGDCVDTAEIAWECLPTVVIRADPDKVGNAIGAWRRLASSSSAEQTRLACGIAHAAGASIPCSFCDAEISAPALHMTLMADGLRFLDTQRSKRRTMPGKTFRELLVSQAIHLTHLAGAHLLLDAPNASVTLSFSIA